MDKYQNWLACLGVLLCITSNQGLIRGPWSAWSSCSANCDGTQERTRTCVADVGESCDGLTSDSRSCNAGICVTTAIIVCLVLGLLLLLALIVTIYLIIKRRKILKENERAGFNTNAAEDYYDRSIRSSSYGSRPGTTTSSVASSRATIPTIAPYLPDVEEEDDPPLEYTNRAYDDNDSLGMVSFSNESIQEARMDFDVDEVEAVHENSPPAEPPKVTMMTFAGTQTGPGDDDGDSDLGVTIDII